MSNNFVDVRITGLEGLDNTFDRYSLSDSKIRKKLDETGIILEEAIKKNAPELSGYTKDKVKHTVSNYDGELGCKIKGGGWDAGFIDWGSSRNKEHVNWFENAIDSVWEEVKENMEGFINGS